MSLSITLVNDSGSITTASVQSSDKPSALAAAASAAFGIPPQQQKFLYDGNLLAPDVTFSNAGISDGDLIVVTRQFPLPNNATGGNNASGANSTPNSNAGALNTLRNNMDLPTRSPPLSSDSQQNANPQMRQFLTDLFRGINPNTGNSIGRREQGLPTGAPRTNAQSRNFLDPMSLEGQKAIEDQIRQENINQNMEAALEHNPEAFGRVFMLFIDCKINSASNVKAFIDRYVGCSF